MIHFIVWLCVAAFAGFVASKLINKSGSGLLMDIVLGAVGGFIGGFIVSRIPALAAMGGGFVAEVIIAILGAMLVIFVYNMVFRRSRV